jgi:hypothetical protein
VYPKIPQKRKKSNFGLIWRLQDTLVRLEELKIEYVPNEENLPNVPQIRPIENFWANFKIEIYSNNDSPKDVKYLMLKIIKEQKSIKTTRTRKAMEGVPAKVRKAHRLGVTIFASNLCIV